MFHSIRRSLTRFYTLQNDPYLDAIHSCLYAIVAFFIVMLLMVIYQWPEFLLACIIAPMMVFFSNLPFGQNKKQRIKAATIVFSTMILSLIGGALVIEDRLLSILWIAILSLTLYGLTLKFNQYRPHIILSLIFAPIFIHLFYDAKASAPFINPAIVIDYLMMLVICFAICILINLFIPERKKARSLIAAIDCIYCIGDIIDQLRRSNNLYDNITTLYRAYKHIYFLRDNQAALNSLKSTSNAPLLQQFIDLTHVLLLNIVYLANNRCLNKSILDLFYEKINHLTYQTESQQDTMDRSFTLLYDDVDNHAIAETLTTIDKLLPIYQQICQLRKANV